MFGTVWSTLCVLLFSHSVVSDFLRLHGPQQARFPCPSLSPRVCSNSCPLSRWCHPTILSSITPFSTCLQSFPASRPFLMSWLFLSGGQSAGASASALVLSVNIQGWFSLGLNSLISLLSKGLSRVFFQHHSSKASILWCSASWWSNSHIPYMTTGKTIALTI